MDFLWVNLLGVQSNYQQGKSRNMKYTVRCCLQYNVGPLATNAIKVLYFIPFHFISWSILGLTRTDLTVCQYVINRQKGLTIFSGDFLFWVL